MNVICRHCVNSFNHFDFGTCLFELPCGRVALADAEGGEAEPVREDAAALVVGVEGQEAVEAILLLAPAARPTQHFRVLGLHHSRIVQHNWVEIYSTLQVSMCMYCSKG